MTKQGWKDHKLSALFGGLAGAAGCVGITIGAAIGMAAIFGLSTTGLAIGASVGVTATFCTAAAGVAAGKGCNKIRPVSFAAGFIIATGLTAIGISSALDRTFEVESPNTLESPASAPEVRI